MPRLNSRVSGVVFTPFDDGRHLDLLDEVQRSNREAVLDPNTIELALPGGFTTSRAKLPWAGSCVHTATEYSGGRFFGVVDVIAQHAVTSGYSAVLAPTHCLVEGLQDAWLPIDRVATRRLRTQLDAAGSKETRIFYPLAISTKQLRQEVVCENLTSQLSGLPIDGLWLRVYPFGGTSIGPSVLRGQIRACRAFHRLRLPIVAEKTGAAGLAMMAFGSVGGIESGVTIGENFNIYSLRRPPDPSREIRSQRRIYLPSIGTFLPAAKAEALFANRWMKAKLGCRDSGCCRRGTGETLENPKHHFLNQRSREVFELSEVPEPLRPQMYLERFLRPATDLARDAKDLEPALTRWHRQLEDWRRVLGDMAREEPPVSFARPPASQLDRRRGA